MSGRQLIRRHPWVLVLSVAAAACDSTSEPLPPLGGNAELNGSALTVRGSDAANDFRIEASGAGITVVLDGVQETFEGSLRSISFDGGAGDDVIRFDQEVVGDLDVVLMAGEGDDDVGMAVVPTGSGEAMTLGVVVDTGDGMDRVDFLWSSTARPDLVARVSLDVDGTLSLPEIEDEVLVSFQGGDPDQPIVVGSLWNSQGPPPASSSTHRSFSFAAALTSDSANVELRMLGDIGADSIDVEADYSGVLSQQGRIAVDADVGDGNNHVGTYLVTGARHTFVETSVIAGPGSDVVDLEHVLGGDAEVSYALDVGDGDNSASVRFGDGIRGARPTTGARNVTGSYRSGGGSDAVELRGNVVEPVTSTVTLDLGTGQGSVIGRYSLDLPAPDAESGSQPKPSQVKVLLLAPDGSELDLAVDVPDPDPDDGTDEPGKVAVVGSGLRGADLTLGRLLDIASSPDGPILQDEWILEVRDLDVATRAAITGTAGGEVRRMVYLQDRLHVDAGAAVDVGLTGSAGPDAILAHLFGVSGDGTLSFLADAGPGGDVVAAQTRDLSSAGTGELSFEVRGGDADDTAALAAPADLQRIGSVVHLLVGGGGTDGCHASTNVTADLCETVEGITEQLRQILTDLFGAELASEW